MPEPSAPLPAARPLLLASASPRRRTLLAQIGVRFEVVGVAVDETARPLEEPVDYVVRLAETKARAGRALAGPLGRAASPVLAADTAVVIAGALLGKPLDREDSGRMLRLLSGRTHAVLTAVALATTDGLRAAVSRSEVTFRVIDEAEARAYWDTGEPRDKAGGYAVQGLGAVFVRELRGSYSGVMGLPLYETAELLRSAGIPRWDAIEDGSDEH